MARIELIADPKAARPSSSDTPSTRFGAALRRKVIFWGVSLTLLCSAAIFLFLAIHRADTPDHLVAAGVPVEETVPSQISAQIARRTDAITLTLEESSLTASARQMIEKTGATIVDIEQTQVAVIAGSEVEFYLPLVQDAPAAGVTIAVKPVIEEGGLQFKLTRLSVGSLPLPRWLFTWSLQAVITQATAPFNEAIRPYAQLTAVELSEGSLVIQGTLIVEE